LRSRSFCKRGRNCVRIDQCDGQICWSLILRSVHFFSILFTQPWLDQISHYCTHLFSHAPHPILHLIREMTPLLTLQFFSIFLVPNGVFAVLICSSQHVKNIDKSWRKKRVKKQSREVIIFAEV
jgi:hypothetical protein